MPRRTQVMQVLPWTGGLDTSVDSGVLNQQALVQAENVVFSTAGVRRKREGHSYFDVAIPAIVSRASDNGAGGAGTTRTIVFASDVSAILFVGEAITLSTTTTSGNEFTYYPITAGVILSVSTTTITLTGSGSLLELTAATSTLTAARTYPIVKMVDYWYFLSGSLAQKIVGISSQPFIYTFTTAGVRGFVAKDGGATARVGTALKVDAVVFNEALIIAQSRTGNLPIKYKTSVDADWRDLPGSPPDFSICCVHLNRIFTNNKANRDRIEYCATANEEKWNGADDSGAIDVRPGDGDPVGITAIFTFKGRLFVGKSKKLYQIVGDSPENFQVLDVSNGIGIISQDSVAQLDQDDVFYASTRGLHSIGTTASFGDFEGQFISAKIQPTFNSWTASRQEYIKSLYIPFLNSVAFSVSEDSTSAADTMYLYNINNKEWYQWPEALASAMCIADISSTKTFLYAAPSGRVWKANNGTYVDNTATPILFRIKSGSIYPDNSVLTLKAFKRVTLFFRPFTSYSLTVIAKIDKYSSQTLTFSETVSGDLLGSTFVLGVSLLGTDTYFSSYTLPIDGVGHGITLEVQQSGVNQQGDIYGYAIEWEPCEIVQETL